jgi:hypothetical protein
MLAMAALIAGALWFVVATFAFRRCAPADGPAPRWVQAPEMQALVVFVVLGGWALGGSFFIYGLVNLFW